MQETRYPSTIFQDRTNVLEKRVDDAFQELETQRTRMAGLTRENSELRDELLQMQNKVHTLKIGLRVTQVALIIIVNIIALFLRLQ